MFVDVHTHVTAKEFDADRERVILESGCIALINNGYSAADNRATLDLSKKYPLVKKAFGLHPDQTWNLPVKEVDEEIAWIRKHKPFAIGEIGLDFLYAHPEKQIDAFKKFISLALELDLPMIVHSRKAEKEVLDVLEDMHAKKVILHCFSGKLKLVDRAEKLGYFFSIPGIIVHSLHFQELVKRASITKLLTETDAPFLSPIKGERNEPKYIPLTIQKIAEVKGMDEKEVENSIFANYQRLFR
ncbi:TatD family hydrolase [Candidatus Woesearchaeota archaeon]|nr:TatD family hydrolase [Candidatus Woesearchaeota archaeon]